MKEFLIDGNLVRGLWLGMERAQKEANHDCFAKWTCYQTAF